MVAKARAILIFAVSALMLSCTAELLEVPEMEPTSAFEETLDRHVELDMNQDERSPVRHNTHRAREILAKLSAHCKATAKNLKIANSFIGSHRAAVTKSLVEAKKICAREKKLAKNAHEKKAKLSVKGPTFKFSR